MTNIDTSSLRFVVTAKAKVAADAPSSKGFAWILGKLLKGEDISDRMELRHEGRCGACGRKLTTPESIDTGIGPVCAERMGIAHGTTEAASFDALSFLTAGNATVTATSVRTGTRFTYKVTRAKGDDAGRPFFVSLLTGTDNETSYSYLGTLFVGDRPSRPAPRPEADPEAEMRDQEDAYQAELAAAKAEAVQAERPFLGRAADGGPTSRYCECREGDTHACDKCMGYRAWMSRRESARRADYRRTVFGNTGAA